MNCVLETLENEINHHFGPFLDTLVGEIAKSVSFTDACHIIGQTTFFYVHLLLPGLPPVLSYLDHPSITLGSPYLPWIKLGEVTHLLYQGLIERGLTSFGGMKPVDEVMSYIGFCE